MRRLDLTRVDLADNAPSRHVSQRKDEDEHNDDPASRTLATNDVVGCVQAPNDKHAEHEKQPAPDDNCSATELVHCQESGDRDQEHEYCRDTRCEKRRRRARETCLCEKRRGVLVEWSANESIDKTENTIAYLKQPINPT